MMEDAVVRAEGLTKLYNEKVRALDDADLNVCRGEWLAVMGPSGSGKTTLLNLIACLDRPTTGQLVVAGIDVSTLDQAGTTRFRRDHVGLIFQQFHLIPYLTAVENVMLAQYFHSMADETEARAAVERVGLGDRLHHLPSQLSGGEKQRVCIARALINQPDLILADEPTGNLDKANKETVITLLNELHAAGHTLIVVSHDPVIGDLAGDTIWLDHGRVVRLQRNAADSEGGRPTPSERRAFQISG
jgi:putative ABC transport system ATP-binding protein